jgi:putative aldouronate transport system permease protein
VKFKGIGGELKKNRVLYLMAVPGILAFLAFNYLPMFGLIVAFKEYNFRDGLFGSPWIGLENFRFFVGSPKILQVIRNTVVLNISFIAIHTVMQVGSALMLNEVSGKWFKKSVQSLMFLPYFVSWIIVSVFVYNIFSYEYGVLNGFLDRIGAEKVNFYAMSGAWPFLLMLVDSWKWVGYGAVIYLAALAGIDDAYYEAARIDGASRWQCIRHISIPLIMPVILILTLLAIGRILNADFGMFYGIIGDNSILFKYTDVIETFVYRSLRQLGDVGMASAVGFVQSIIGFGLVVGSNTLVRRYRSEGALF